jgi:ribosomal protein L7/L12
MPSDLSDADRQSIETDLRAGRKISAIKTYREATGTDLKEAKDAVEAIEAELRGASPSRLPDAVRKSIEANLFAGRPIPAIKTYREATGAGLKEAKDAVEAMEADLRKTSPRRFSAPQANKAGCLTMILLVIAPAVFLIRVWS